MSKVKELLIEVMLRAIKVAGKAEMQAALLGIKGNNNEETYQSTLQGLYSSFLLLKQAANKTKSKVDDGIIDLVLEAVKDNAKSGGIILS